MRAALLLFACTLAAHAQWQILDAHTTADLRGIDNVGKGVVWASGTHGTVLRSEDNGADWQNCTVPSGAEQLDFRGIQAFDANTAIVMSSGKGELSRLYKTTDGCQTWKLVFTNPDKEGFWDTLRMTDLLHGWLLGDPVRGRFALGRTDDGGKSFLFLSTMADGEETNESAPKETSGRGAFAASNSALALPLPSHFSRQKQVFNSPCETPVLWFGTGGPGGAAVFRFSEVRPQCSDYGSREWAAAKVPISGDSASSGVFSLATADDDRLVAVGGDYLRTGDQTRTEASSSDSGKTWTAATTPPHGYRSAVAYDAPTKTWITVGPNGTDISTDDGRNWRALKPGAGDAPDADQHWNALSLPFVVGPKGRIGMLEPGALKGK
jgi:photosystem II stability/assembly factor-like uncharacterized protein